MVLSVFVALILSPALCATMLKRPQDHHESFLARRFPRIGEWGTTAADKFNHGFERLVDRSQGAVRSTVDKKLIFIVIYALVVALLALMFLRLPTSFQIGRASCRERVCQDV